MSMKSFARFISGPKYGSSFCDRAPKKSISLPPLALVTPPATAFGHRAHRCAAGTGADHEDVAARVVRHQEALAERANHLHAVALQIDTHVVRCDATNRLAVVVFGDALYRERNVVVVRTLAIARAGDGVLPRVVRPAMGIGAGRDDADRCPSSTGNGVAPKSSTM